MAQAYFPSRALSMSPTHEKDSTQAGFAPSHAADLVAHAADVQEAYIDQKNRLVSAIDATGSLLKDVRAFNKDSWVVRYPQLTTKPSSLVRSMSFVDEPASVRDVMVTSPRHPLQRSVTLASIAQMKGDIEEPIVDDDSGNFSVLRLDLKMGPAGGPAALVSQLEKASIANLVDERIQTSMAHMDKLRNRIQDTSSKVLVTGDLNAGKSTFVNALLRREAMPVDQQPCTSLFCEVHDAAENNGVEEVHVVNEGKTYSINDQDTFSRRPISDLDKIVTESDVHHSLKVYIADPRPQEQSLLHNGIVDISLIDAPGLNTDSLKTTAVFARQEEIDVVVFVVSAENHFTLSAQDFLWNASNEKAYLFIVVNKFDQIRDKERCKRRVLEQIKKLSPRTWDDAEDLVHFVDSSVPEGNESFGKLESALRSFVLVKRAKSKLLPATTYLTNLLADVDLLASANSIVAQSELEQAKDDLSRSRPVLEKMKAEREQLEDGLENVEDERTSTSGARTNAILSSALDRVAQGELALASSRVAMPTYPGLLNIWEYVTDVRRSLLASIDLAVKQAEDEARVVTTQGVNEVSALGDRYLPEGVERSKRVFMPEAMFTRPAKTASRRSTLSRAAGAQYGLGLGLASRAELLEPTFADIFDVQHYVSVHFNHGGDQKDKDDDAAFGVLSLASVGVGALTVAGGKALGARGLLEAVMRLSDLLGNESTRKWIAPVLGGLVLAGAAYLVLELPSSVPRTVGRRIRSELDADGARWASEQRERVMRETRKVLRLASWDLRERFRGAMEERGREVRGAEEAERRAERALAWFAEVTHRTVEAREIGGLGVFSVA